MVKSGTKWHFAKQGEGVQRLKMHVHNQREGGGAPPHTSLCVWGGGGWCVCVLVEVSSSLREKRP